MSTPRLYEWVRVLRYVGAREAVDLAIERRQIKGTSPSGWGAGKISIYEALVSETAQPVPTTPLRDLVYRKLEEAGKRHFDHDVEKQAHINALQEILEELEL